MRKPPPGDSVVGDALRGGFSAIDSKLLFNP